MEAVVNGEDEVLVALWKNSCVGVIEPYLLKISARLQFVPQLACMKTNSKLVVNIVTYNYAKCQFFEYIFFR